MNTELRRLFDELISVIRRGVADAYINDQDGTVVGQDARVAEDRIIKEISAIQHSILAFIDSQIITE
jgi:hypothetical protein